MNQDPDVEAGTEPDLHLLECARCGEPMYHRVVGVSAEYDLWYLWETQCCECGHLVEAWEERQVAIKYGGGNDFTEGEEEVAGDVDETLMETEYISVS